MKPSLPLTPGARFPLSWQLLSWNGGSWSSGPCHQEPSFLGKDRSFHCPLGLPLALPVAQAQPPVCTSCEDTLDTSPNTPSLFRDMAQVILGRMQVAGNGRQWQSKEPLVLGPEGRYSL